MQGDGRPEEEMPLGSLIVHSLLSMNCSFRGHLSMFCEVLLFLLFTGMHHGDITETSARRHLEDIS